MKTITSDYTIAPEDAGQELHVDASSGDLTIQVPLGMEAMITKVFKIDPSPNAVTIETDFGHLTMRAPNITDITEIPPRSSLGKLAAKILNSAFDAD